MSFTCFVCNTPSLLTELWYTGEDPRDRGVNFAEYYIELHDKETEVDTTKVKCYQCHTTALAELGIQIEDLNMEVPQTQVRQEHTSVLSEINMPRHTQSYPAVSGSSSAPASLSSFETEPTSPSPGMPSIDMITSLMQQKLAEMERKFLERVQNTIPIPVNRAHISTSSFTTTEQNHMEGME